MARKPAASPRTEKRGAKRYTLVLRAGKLITDHGEFLCVLRDVSAGGLKVRLFHQLPDPGCCALELAGGERYRIECAWHNGDHLGFRFTEGTIDVPALLEEAGPFPKRHIRLRLRRAWPVLVRALDDGFSLAASLRDVSQHGAALDCAAPLAIGQRIRIEGAQLGRIEARVRWRRGETYGAVFQQGFRLDELARLAADLQSNEILPEAQFVTARVNQ